MKSFRLFLIVLAFCYGHVSLAQEIDLSKQQTVCKQSIEIANTQSIQKGIEYLDNNSSVFDKTNELHVFMYKLFKSNLLYQNNQYQEAYALFKDLISVIDANQQELFNSEQGNTLSVYYMKAIAEEKLNYDKDKVEKSLNRAKEVYELSNLTQTPVYTAILQEIEAINGNVINDATKGLYNASIGMQAEAIPHLERFMSYINKYRKHDVVGRAKFAKGLGTCYLGVGRLKEAEQLFSGSIEELEKEGNVNDTIYRELLDASAVFYLNVHNYQKASQLCQKAKYNYEKNLDFRDSYVRCLANNALCQMNLGHKTLAKIYIDVSIKQARTNFGDNSDLLAGLNKLNSMNEHQFKTRNLDEQTRVMTSVYPYVIFLSSASTIYQELGYFGDAVQLTKEAVEICQQHDLEVSLPYNNLATLYLYKSRFKEAASYYETAYKYTTTAYEYDDIAFNYALSLYLSESRELGKLVKEVSEKMRNHVHETMSILSTDERANYWKHLENYLPMLNLMLYSTGDVKKHATIYDNILLSKGLLLRTSNQVKNAIYASNNVENINSYEKLVRLRKELSAESDSTAIATLKSDIDKLDKQLTQKASAYAQFMKDVNWKDVRDKLGSNDIAIEFYNIPLIYKADSVQNMDGEPRYCAVVLKQGVKNPSIIPLFKESLLKDLENDELMFGDMLYNNVWSKLTKELQGVKNIYFSADRELHKIGIEYALMPNGKRMNEVYNIYRLSSTRELVDNNANSPISNALLYGGLQYDLEEQDLIAKSRNSEGHQSSTDRALDIENLRYGVSYLPGTKVEVDLIDKSLESSGISYTTYTGGDGTEESFKTAAGSGKYNILHLATHGFF